MIPNSYLKVNRVNSVQFSGFSLTDDGLWARLCLPQPWLLHHLSLFFFFFFIFPLLLLSRNSYGLLCRCDSCSNIIPIILVLRITMYCTADLIYLLQYFYCCTLLPKLQYCRYSTVYTTTLLHTTVLALQYPLLCAVLLTLLEVFKAKSTLDKAHRSKAHRSKISTGSAASFHGQIFSCFARLGLVLKLDSFMICLEATIFLVICWFWIPYLNLFLAIFYFFGGFLVFSLWVLVSSCLSGNTIGYYGFYPKWLYTVTRALFLQS